MNDSPRSRIALDGIRSRDRWFARALRSTALPVPLLLGGVLLHLLLEAAAAATSSIPILALLRGTATLSLAAVAVAVPAAIVGVLASRRILSARWRGRLSVLLCGLSAMPMVALGFVFAEAVGPAIGRHVGLATAHPALTALAMGFGLLPALWHRFLAAFDEVPAELVQGGYALGAAHRKVLLSVELPAALPMLGRSTAEGLARCAGESMVVLMVSGNAATAWGGGDGAAALAPALLSMLHEALPGSPEWAEAHRVALLLVVVCVGLHMAGRTVFRRRNP